MRGTPLNISQGWETGRSQNLQDRRVTITEIEQELDPSQEPVHSVVYNSRAYSNICAE